MSQINITIDGKKCIGEAGQTILQIATANGIEIPTLCYDEKVKIYGACGLCVVEVEGIPKLLRSCATVAAEGQVVMTHTKRVDQSRKIALELLMSDHEGDCKGPCTLNCPAGTDAQGYVKQIALGNDREAVKIIKEKVPLPASIGRVCPHPCEQACRRNYVEEPISIAFLKAFAADNDLASGDPYRADCAEETGKKVGIIGGGPAGLSAAYDLVKKGHHVTIIDAMPKMGGMLRYGIPEYRLPKAVLDMEIEHIASYGVEMKNNVKIGADISFDEFRAQYDAVLVAVGAWKSSGVGCDGEDTEGVYGGIDFLREVALGQRSSIGKNVAVVGGGNTAMDACRTAVRLGAEHVYVVYRRTRKEMPAEDIEIQEAIEEGVDFKFLTNPAEIISQDGHVKEVKLQVMELGEPDSSGRRSPVPVEGKFEMLTVDSVIAAIGQKSAMAGLEAIECNRKGNIAADEGTFATNLDGVFAAGDITNKGAGIAIAAIDEANRAAEAIDAYLNGEKPDLRVPYLSKREEDEGLMKQLAAKEKAARAVMPQRAPEERNRDLEAINLGFTDEQARAEAKRCLECGCHDYDDCKLIRYAGACEICPERLKGEKHPNFTEERLVSIERNQGKCILCGLCVRVCDEEVGKGLLGLVGRGFTTVVKPEFRDLDANNDCMTCKKCAEACPTGALKIIR